ncbi:MAG: gamma-glutamyl-gamma-aminobutyrate hydrolase family protein [Acidimicrobiales bacterium]
MTRPLIGVTGRRWPALALGPSVPPGMSGLSIDLHFTDYVRSIALAGGLPVELTRDADVTEMVERLDGLVLSGGADVEPARYGARPDERLGPLETDRDAWEFELYEAARERDLPVLAICRGFQLVNVAHGGTLNQHVGLDEGAGHPQWDVDGRTATHDVRSVPATAIAGLVGEHARVNSLHHQTLDRLGAGLVASAYASDGVVEGFESVDGDVLGVQWHPELLDAPDPTFRWLVERCRDRLRLT